MSINRLKVKRTFLQFVLTFAWFASVAQTGDFILTHHAPKHSEIDNINFEIKADKNGIICIANRFGVLKYDGNDWDFYRTSSSALSLAISEDNTVYVGCLGEFGKLDYTNNSYEYIPILARDSLSDHFLQTFATKDYIYFLSDRSLYSYDLNSSEVKMMMDGDFLNGYLFKGQLYVNTYDEQIFLVNGAEATLLENTIQWGLRSSSPNGQTEFAVDMGGGLYYNNGGELKKHHHYDRLQEADVVITDLEWVNDTLVACSTIESGVFFLHVNDSSYFEVTDYHSGLPDNEIHDLYADNNQGVWVAHEFGLTRIAPLFPAYSYTNFPGLEGNLIEVQRIHNDLWINTSLGVYYFSQDTSYRSRVYVERVEKKATSRSSRSKPVVKKEEEPNDPPKVEEEEKEEEQDNGKRKKKGFLSGLFKKKDRASESSQEEETGAIKKKFLGKNSESTAPIARERDKAQYIRRVEKVVTGVSYQFHHVPGTDGKFRQLLEAKDRILATSHTGIFEISRNSAQLVINEAIRYAYLVPNTNKLIISTERGILKYYDLINDIWTEISRQQFEDIILNVYMDHKDHIWLAGTSHIYQGVIDEQGFRIEHSYEINNRFYDELSIWEHSDVIYFINSQGYFKLDREKDRIVKDRELEKELGSPHHHLHNEKSRVWLFNGKIWHLLLPDGSINEFQYLGVFPNLKYINYDEKLDRYWLITDDNQLLAYAAGQIPELHESYAIFVKRLIGKQGEMEVNKKFALSHDQNTLSVELLKPDYVGLLNPEYQYKLEGLNTEWSKWTHANLIDYSYLPPGEYKLKVRVRDALDQLDEETLLEFSVATPYWQQPWFYFVQVLIMAGMIAVSSRLSEKKKINRIIKHGLSILTLVIIIQFMQALITTTMEFQSTPVMEFLFDVAIAVMVFPLEFILRKLILDGGLKVSGTTARTKL